MENMTRKQLESINKPIYYLNGAHTLLLNDDNKIGTNYGVYGFNWTAYEYHSYIIVTGNRNYPKNAITIVYYDSAEAMNQYRQLRDEYGSSFWSYSNTLKKSVLDSLIDETNK